MDKNTKRNIQQFNGERYSVWKFRVKSLLAELNVLYVIEETIPGEPSDKWHKDDLTAKSVIIEYLSDSFLGFAKNQSNARDVFMNLDTVYERRSLATQLALRKRLLSLKLRGDMSLLQHFTCFDDLMSELLAAGAKLDEMDKISHLLLTLPSSYDGVITALETLSEDNLNLSFVKTRLLDHEVKLLDDSTATSLKVLHTFSSSQTTDGMGSKSGSHNKKKPRRQFHPTKGKQPEKFKRFKQHSPYKTSNIKCDHCGRRNHLKKDCYFYNQMIERQRTIQTIHPKPKSYKDKGFAFMMSRNNSHASKGNKEVLFLLDSGATDHIVNQEDLLTRITDLPTPIEISVAKNDTTVIARRRGSIEVISNLGVKGTLENVLFIPEVPHNLISVPRLQEKGMVVIFDKSGVKIKQDEVIIAKGKPINGLMGINFKIPKDHGNNINMVNTNNYQLWHERLGHPSCQSFLKLKRFEMVENVNQIKHVNPVHNALCEACIYGKQSRLPFSKSKSKDHVKRPLFIVHSDVCGPISPPTIDNKNYFVTFIDDFTHYTVTYLLKFKSEVLKVFKDFVAKSEAHFNNKIVYLYCDNGGEYLSNEFREYCVQKGITFHLTVPHTPQQNGVAERMNRTITEKARTMIFTSGLEKLFWGEAVLTATYLINILPTAALHINKTPYELWHNRRPRLDLLKIFGSTVYVHIKTRKTKFDEKSIKGILVGYAPNGYKVWNVKMESFILARDVIVDETNFKITRPAKSDTEVSSVPKTRKTDSTSEKLVDIEHENIPIISQPSDELNPLNLRRSERIKTHPLPYYKEDLDQEINMDVYSNLLCAQSLMGTIPKSYGEIKTRDDRGQWEQAIKDELDSLTSNNTWSLVSKPTNKNIVQCKWVFTIKIDEHGNPIRYKARLVAKGFSQQYLSDYNETFAPVARISTFRLLLAFSNQYKLLVHHMDVKTAFLNGILQEEIYMKVPEGINADNNNKVCKLHKSIYGLKQSSRCWYEHFDKTIKGLNFKSSLIDPCLYILDKGDITKNIYVILYVDDILISTGDKSAMSSFKIHLMNKFKMKDLQDVKHFLGIRVQRTENTITLDQSYYLKTVLKKFNMSECRPVSTPLENKLNYHELNSDETIDAPCRNLIGCLMYAMLCTRPDLCISINILSRYQSKSNKELWICLKRVLRYIKGSIDLKLIYKRSDTCVNMIEGYVDSDWGNNEVDRKSTTGYLFRAFENCTISWNSKRQASVAASSTEAEYMALFECVKEAIWLRNLLSSINLNMQLPITIFEDNNGCISIARNSTNHKRTKHIDIKYHFTREQILQNKVIVKYIPTGEQLADAFTKPLPTAKFLLIRSNIGLQ